MASSNTYKVNLDVEVRPFMDGEALTAERLNELVAKIDKVANAPQVSMVGALGGVACAAVARNPRLSRRSLLGLR